ncbi:30S ribosomal protein S12 methylthiotransferase RimO [Gloeobacter kilaueensis]|uniref:Ribosomal protein uS12 methylthiotransferase RimO n=1 Tax=Gloeobacter kilaueensis (strain ATCC BAA-2537 / CCAP 1431/1 / ULC 316 / JS1) TaxID=1183438 RepID=U5QGA0_GLOK1|nr:30S ribosomal protein S12 methylthiotransferase RimO [Gloeobacter kilaueensis]AGY57888.1 ribosomal protein S12 methylthiotransferase [Gloeobacter kilaueensis JS1]
MPPTIAVTHLGCEKNRIDTEHMLGLLVQAGYQVDSDEQLADYVLVNTCSFIGPARTESVRTLVQLAEQGKKIVIAGCLAQHFQGELLKEIPEAVAIVGTGDYHRIVEVIERSEKGERVELVSATPTFIADEHVPRYRTTSEAVAYLKIAEGCDYRCAFCIIPHLRGNQRSRPIESIVAEARQLAAEGVKELLLISQISTNYGLDLYGRPRLADLLRALGEVDIPWIRLHYAYPTGLTAEVLEAIRETPNLLPYFDVPLQHSHPEVLRAMNRPWQADFNERLLGRIREELPEATLRTTFVVGFPGESEVHFAHLCDFVERLQFDHVGVFAYSREENTAAAQLPDQLSEAIKKRRRRELMQRQQVISARRNADQVGKVVPVLIEQENPRKKVWLGRSPRFAPEIDGQIVVSGGAQLNALIPVRITGSDVYDLYGEVF